VPVNYCDHVVEETVRIVRALQRAILVYLVICLWGLLVPNACAQSPALFIRGLPCPGNQGEPTNSHPLVWQSRSGMDGAQVRPWANWQDTVRIEYGGAYAEQQRSFRDLAFVLVLAVVLVFTVLLFEFGGFAAGS